MLPNTIRVLSKKENAKQMNKKDKSQMSEEKTRELEKTPCQNATVEQSDLVKKSLAKHGTSSTWPAGPKLSSRAKAIEK